MDSPLTAAPLDRAARVVLADDECLFRASLRHLLAVPPSVVADVYGVDVGAGFQVVGEAGSGEETVRLVHAVQPDLLLLDVCMPRRSGLDALRELAEAGDLVPTVILAGTISRAHLVDAIRCGVRGLVVKNATTEVLFEAMRWVLEGRCWLDQTLITDLVETARPLMRSVGGTGRLQRVRFTQREREILGFIVAGYANKDIALASAVSEDTIKHHLTRIFDKVGVSNRLELAMIATEQGLIDPTCHPH